MRILLAGLLVTLSLAGCLGSYEATSVSDVHGNEYVVVDSKRAPPADGKVVEGITAMERLDDAGAMAKEWADDANLVFVVGVELKEGAVEPAAQPTGPRPDYTQWDETIGDGLAPAWNYLYVSPSMDTQDGCEVLFVHAAHNGFIASFAFDPEEQNIGGGEAPPEDGCEHLSTVASQMQWTVDSDKGSEVLMGQQEYANRTKDANMAVWIVHPAPDEDPEDQAEFNTVWSVGIGVMEPGTPFPKQFVACITPASPGTAQSMCFDFSDFDFDLEDEPEEPVEPEVPDPELPESGTGTIAATEPLTGGSNEDSFTIQNENVSPLTVDFTLAAGSSPGSMEVRLVNPDGETQDTATVQYNGAEQSGTLSVSTVGAGTWEVQVVADFAISGTPETSYSWCAEGYDYETLSSIPCE